MTNKENLSEIVVSVNPSSMDSILRTGELEGITFNAQGTPTPAEHDAQIVECYREMAIHARTALIYADSSYSGDQAKFDHASDMHERWSNRATFLEALYDGWARYTFHPDGHIHRGWGRGCPSLRPDTELHPLPDLSGSTPEKAIGTWGCVICSKCFPTAPVEWTKGEPWERRAKRLERAISRLPEVRAAERCRINLQRRERTLQTGLDFQVSFLEDLYHGPWQNDVAGMPAFDDWCYWLERKRDEFASIGAKAPKQRKSIANFQAKLKPLAEAEAKAVAKLLEDIVSLG